ncbi:MAG: 3-deoxy-manno-octulosonate cytidylyltransferase [Chloroflexota bacterium]
MRAIGVIPARYASTRLPGKPLARLAGIPLIERVWRAATHSRELADVVVATDDERIADFCRSIGARYAMTPSELPSGTDRIYAALQSYGGEWDVAVNIQGDEPLITGEMIDSLVAALEENVADVATFVSSIKTSEELSDPSCVKVVLNCRSEAMYFSRSIIPCVRDAELPDWINRFKFFKHIGIYAYKMAALEKFVGLPPSSLEIAEKLEQLRLLEQGAVFLCLETRRKLIGIDTPEDVEAFERYLNGNK